MGFFSWNCKACGHSILSHHAIESNNEWMTRAVILNSDGEIMRGEYDGYGRCGSYDYNESCGDPEMYHEACWEVIGKPTEFTGASESSRDQGYFFDDNVHNVHPPKDLRDLENIKIAGDLAEKACRSSWEAAHLEYLISNAYDAIEKMEDRSEDIEKVFEDLSRHIKRRNEKETQQEAYRLGLALEDYIEMRDHLRALQSEDEDEYRKERPAAGYTKAEKRENGHFRVETDLGLIVDHDFENDKAYMVYDPYEEIEPGTEREDWLKDSYVARKGY
jgi:hypothetical protein